VRVPASVDDLPPAPPETVRQRIQYWQYRAVWDAAARMPEPVARRIPATAGAAWYRAASDRQLDQVRRNLSRVLGHPPADELEEVVKDAYVSYARYWLDSFRLHVMSPRDVLDRSTGENLELVDELIASGKGGILATGHLGSWDIGALFTSQRNWGMAVVAEVVEPRRLFHRFVELRRTAGIEVFPLVRGGDMVQRLEGVVERGGLATLLADRDLTKKGPVVDFFGEPCRLPPGPAVLARRTGRPVAVGGFLTSGDDSFHAVIHSVVDVAHLSVEDGTQVIARELEGLIARAPEQWHVFVPNWLADREPDHPALADASG
jgi:phosphatidylinositol dimannoside acyltransferase